MDFYDHNRDVYKALTKIVGFGFFKQIKDTGIVFQEILEVKNIVDGNEFYLLICFDQFKIHNVRFKDSRGFVFWLRKIAKERLVELKYLEKKLLNINDTESYGENKYFIETEMTAVGIYSIKEFLEYIESIDI